MSLETIGTLLLAILAFGVLIIVHEFGHFITAKRGGVQVNEFWIGMGPTLFSKNYNGTLYCLRLLPFGGACVMEGEDGESDSAHSFAKASLPRRALVLSAGALMNFLIGFLILLALLLPQKQLVSTTIDHFTEGFSSAGETMLRESDEILKVNGYRVLIPSDFSVGLARAGGEGAFDIQVRRDGKKLLLEDVPLTRAFTDAAGNKLYGINFAVEPASLGGYLKNAVYMSFDYARLVWHSVGDLVSGNVGVDQLAGPVGVAEVMAQTAKSSLLDFLNLVAFISINLGVMNLLPLPALDGGRLLFLAIEAIRRKPVPAKYEGWVHGAGLMLLMALMLYVTGNDIIRLITR